MNTAGGALAAREIVRSEVLGRCARARSHGLAQVICH